MRFKSVGALGRGSGNRTTSGFHRGNYGIHELGCKESVVCFFFTFKAVRFCT